MKKFMLLIVAIFLTMHSVEEFYIFKPIQTIQISSTYLLDYQNSQSHESSTLCTINLISVLLLIYLLSKITIKKQNYLFIFIGILAGILSNLPNAGLILFGALLIYFFVCLPFIFGWQDAIKTISYALFFYIGTLVIISLTDFGLTISITYGISFGLIVYFIPQKIMESIIAIYDFTKKFINFSIYRLSSE